jgi:hypothetical protein
MNLCNGVISGHASRKRTCVFARPTRGELYSSTTYHEFATPPRAAPGFPFGAVSCIQAQTTQSQVPNSTSQAPTIKSEVRIVLVDVVVTQGKGETVGGLHREDFKVAEDGSPQAISFFEEHTGGRVSPIALPPEPPVSIQIIHG